MLATLSQNKRTRTRNVEAFRPQSGKSLRQPQYQIHKNRDDLETAVRRRETQELGTRQPQMRMFETIVTNGPAIQKTRNMTQPSKPQERPNGRSEVSSPYGMRYRTDRPTSMRSKGLEIKSAQILSVTPSGKWLTAHAVHQIRCVMLIRYLGQ